MNCETCGRAIHPNQVIRANDICDAIGAERFEPTICDPCTQREDAHIVVSLDEYPDAVMLERGEAFK